VEPATEKPVQVSTARRPLATPHTRRLAREMKVDLSTIQGSGPGGRITDEDLKGGAKVAPEAPTAAPTTPSTKAPTAIQDKYGPTKRVPLKGVRKIIADKMVESYTHAVHVTHCDEADITNLVAIRNKEKAIARKKGVKLTFLPFIAKAALAALKEYPELNASLDEQTNEIVYKKYYHLGMALATDAGLIVPVIRDADGKSILQLGKEMHELADKGRARKLKPEDMQGSSFTITNVGSIGGTVFTPIINYPNTAILGVGRIRELPRMKDGKVQPRHILTLSLSFDHRVADGARAALYMNEVIKHLEDPALLLVDQ